MSFPNRQLQNVTPPFINHDNNLTIYQQNGLLQFLLVTNANVDVAKHYLNSTGWDVNTAIVRFFDDNTDANRNTATHQQPFNFNNNDEHQLGNMQQQRQIIHIKPVRLGSVFVAPIYRFQGSLDDAIQKASKENKWILVNIQQLQNRGNSHCLSNISHHLNREIFKDKDLSSVIKKRCVLCQWVSISINAKRVITTYKPSNIPCIVFIHPTNSDESYELKIPNSPNRINTLKSGLLTFLHKNQPSPVANRRIIKNPLVLIIGITDYLPPTKSLPQIKKDIENMKSLWIDKCGYKNVVCSSSYLEMTDLMTFLRNQAANLQLNGENLSIDGLILIYSGHGNKFGIISSDNKELPLSQTQNIFAASCDCLMGKPKIFYMDCCRGPQKIQKNDIKRVSKGNDNKTYINPLSNFYINYSTSDNYLSYAQDNEFGSYLINAVYSYYGPKFDKKQIVDLVNSSVEINRMVIESSKGQQTAEASNKLLYHVYIRPNK